MTETVPLSEHARAVYDVLLATASRDGAGRLVSTEPLYRFLLDRFGIPDPESRRLRTRLVRELAERGLVRRDNVRGRNVVLLGVDDHGTGPEGDGPDTGYDAYADAAAADLDAGTAATRRVEQSFLRRVLLGGRPGAPCAFCSLLLPADLLVAAHVKRRADLTREERLDFRACAVLACALGCDALYEAGYIAVGADGLVVTARTPPGPLADRLAALDGLVCGGHDDRRAGHFREHLRTRFQGGA